MRSGILDDREVAAALERGDLAPYPTTPTPVDAERVAELRARFLPTTARLQQARFRQWARRGLVTRRIR